MGHRALVAYERTDSTYNLHYTHWGGCNLRLKQTITPKTPYGTAESTTEWLGDVHEALTSGTPVPTVSDTFELEEGIRTDVDVLPQVTGVTFAEAISAHLNYLSHEAFYVVSPSFEVTAYRTHWFGLQYEAESVSGDPTIGNGALRTVRWYDGEPVGDGYACGEFSALKATVGDLIDQDIFTHEQAIAYMKDKLGEWTNREQELVIQTPA